MESSFQLKSDFSLKSCKVDTLKITESLHHILMVYISTWIKQLLSPSFFGASWPSDLNFVHQIVSEKSIKPDPSVRRCYIWNHSAHGLVWICDSTPFSPL